MYKLLQSYVLPWGSLPMGVHSVGGGLKMGRF
jgi:hypothetical protein